MWGGDGSSIIVKKWSDRSAKVQGKGAIQTKVRSWFAQGALPLDWKGSASIVEMEDPPGPTYVSVAPAVAQQPRSGRQLGGPRQRAIPRCGRPIAHVLAQMPPDLVGLSVEQIEECGRGGRVTGRAALVDVC